jgi:4-hydroxy-3-polyprenylbenzoate decarboxylase
MSTSTRTGPRNFVVAISGASGALYAVRTMAALLEQGCHLDVVITDFGRRLLRDELGVVHSNRDLGATIASGSRTTDGMVIVPCSMKTMAGVANGLSRTLVERAADVMLKERKPLVIVPRETPMSLPQLRNMVLCAEAGAIVVPAMPAFYQMPKTLDDLADFMAGKILSILDVEHHLYPAWSGQVER